MREIKAIIRRERVADVVSALHERPDLPGVTISFVEGVGRRPRGAGPATARSSSFGSNRPYRSDRVKRGPRFCEMTQPQRGANPAMDFRIHGMDCAEECTI